MKEKIHRGNYYANIFFLNKAHLLKDKKIKILEISSGTGALLSHLRKRGYDILGTEYTDEAIRTSQKMFGNLGLLKMSGDDLKFPNKSFDLVISFDVFEHIPDTDKHLREVKRVLKDNGIYAFGTPNKVTNIPWEILDKKSLTAWRDYHVSLHTYEGLKRRMEKNNFKYRFADIPLVNEYFEEKIKKRLGILPLLLLKAIQINKWPISMRTNFYVIARNEK